MDSFKNPYLDSFEVIRQSIGGVPAWSVYEAEIQHCVAGPFGLETDAIDAARDLAAERWATENMRR